MSDATRSHQHVRSHLTIVGRATIYAVLVVSVLLLSPMSAVAAPITATADFMGATIIHIRNPSAVDTAHVTVDFVQMSNASVEPAGAGFAFLNVLIHGVQPRPQYPPAAR